MYIPFNNTDKEIYYIDVNSLYPFLMKKIWPVGNPTFFEGDIRKVNDMAFGVFYCEIISPENIQHPIIQSHIKTKNGTRTVSPLGKWYDWICSVEMDNAIKYGYKFKIIKGYTFNKENNFSEFVIDNYKLR